MQSPSLPLLARLDAHDRALLDRLVLSGDPARLRCRSWRALTHLGGGRFSIVVTLALLALPAIGRGVFVRAAISLALSHLLVRLVKQHAERDRPEISRSLIAHPDKFSFPSGHACAAMSVAITYAVCFPTVAPVMVLWAFLVGASRVALGVHYPGDVLAGQCIAILVAIASFS